MDLEFRAFHGTLERHVESILGDGVRPSRNEDEWLGDGSYFFTDGVSDPRLAAMEWGTWIRWANDRDSQRHDAVAVVELSIRTSVKHVLDLRSPLQASLYHEKRRGWLSENFGDPTRSTQRPARRSHDTEYLNHLKAAAGIAAVVANVHMALSLHERFFRAESRIPNVSVLCLSPGLPSDTNVTITGVEIVDPHYSL